MTGLGSEEFCATIWTSCLLPCQMYMAGSIIFEIGHKISVIPLVPLLSCPPAQSHKSGQASSVLAPGLSKLSLSVPGAFDFWTHPESPGSWTDQEFSWLGLTIIWLSGPTLTVLGFKLENQSDPSWFKTLGCCGRSSKPNPYSPRSILSNQLIVGPAPSCTHGF